jgi:hypothetical protein
MRGPGRRRRRLVVEAVAEDPEHRLGAGVGGGRVDVDPARVAHVHRHEAARGGEGAHAVGERRVPASRSNTALSESTSRADAEDARVDGVVLVELLADGRCGCPRPAPWWRRRGRSSARCRSRPRGRRPRRGCPRAQPTHQRRGHEVVAMVSRHSRSTHSFAARGRVLQAVARSNTMARSSLRASAMVDPWVGPAKVGPITPRRPPGAGRP